MSAGTKGKYRTFIMSRMALKSLNIKYHLMVKYILSMQKMLGIEIALGNLYMFFAADALKTCWPEKTVKYRPKPIMSCVTMTWNSYSPQSKSHKACGTQKPSGGQITDP